MLASELMEKLPWEAEAIIAAASEPLIAPPGTLVEVAKTALGGGVVSPDDEVWFEQWWANTQIDMKLAAEVQAKLQEREPAPSPDAEKTLTFPRWFLQPWSHILHYPFSSKFPGAVADAHLYVAELQVGEILSEVDATDNPDLRHH